MRLTQFEISQIKRLVNYHFGANAKVYLFGSRTDDTKKGGDIDLLIQLNEEQTARDIMLKKAAFLSKLEMRLGEQKIDLLIKTNKNDHLSIVKTAFKTGIML